MARYIDADALVDFVLHNTPHINGETTLRCVVTSIKTAPTADVVEVVRCRDCKWLYDEMDDYCCRSHRGLARICENSFCSYGERRANDQT